MHRPRLSDWLPPIVMRQIVRFIEKSGETSRDESPNLALGHARALEARFPELSEFGFNLSTGTAAAVLRFYNEYLALMHPQARGAYLRSLLHRLRNDAPELAPTVTRAIAISDLKDGLPDRAQPLKEDVRWSETLRAETALLEQHYGARLASQPWPGAERGNALLFYLEAHRELIAGKDVLHVAAEKETTQWLAQAARRYTQVDGNPDGGITIGADLTDLPMPDNAFDVAICHRVLEHILDDQSAMRHLHRVLRPGGVLNMSVPQAAHKALTAEWIFPDESHHGHVRHYGQDLTRRLEDVGFRVEVENWLLTRSREELLERRAFPMRMFNAWRA